MSRLFAFGLGRVATALALRLSGEGWRIAGTVRGADKATALRALGIEAWAVEEGTEGEVPPALLADLAQATHVLTSVRPDAAGDPILARFGPALASIGRPLWIGYLSTTGTYGDTGGAWVDEATPPARVGPRGQWRLAAEAAWRNLDPRHRVHVYRIAGIYGPGRNALLDLRDGTARRIERPGHVFSRIHEDDIVQALHASLSYAGPLRLWNLADDEPAEPQEVIAYAARLLGIAPPPLVPFADAALSPMAASFWADRRRVRNDRIKRELGVRLIAPTYREGLALELARLSGV